MVLPIGITQLGQFQGAPGQKGATGTFASASAVTLPADETASVSMSGPEGNKHVQFGIPRGLPGVNAVPTDEAVAAMVTASGTESNAAVDLRTRTRLAPSRNFPPITHPARVVSTFQTGHGWSLIAGTATASADTDEFVLGRQSVRVTTAGDKAVNVIGISGLSGLDMKRHYVRVRFRVDRWENATYYGMRVRTGLNLLTRYRERSIPPSAANTDFGSSDNPKLIGGNNQWQTATASFSILDGDRLGSNFDLSEATSIGITVQDNGSPLTVWINEVALIPKADAFPHGVVSFTFDDGRTSQWTNGYPILSARGMPATMFVIRDRTDAGTHVTHDNLRAMQNAGWEIAAHTDTLANHDLPRGFHSLSPTEVADDIASQKAWLLEHGYNGAEVSAYPQGWYDEATVSVARQFFTSVRTTITDGGLETLPPADPYRVRCIHLAANSQWATVQAQIDAAHEFGDWLIFYTHDVVDDPSGASTTPQMLSAIADYVETKQIPVRTYGEVLRSLTSAPPAPKVVIPEPPHILGPTPSEYGLLGWNYDPLMATEDVESAPIGTLLGTRVYAKPGTLLAGVNLAFKATVPESASGCWVGVYSSSGIKLSQVSGDQSAAFRSGGERRFGMPTFTVPEDGTVIVVLLVGSAPNRPAWCGVLSDRASSFGFPGTGRTARAFTVGSNLTALPASINMSNVTRTHNVPWVGLST